MTNSKRTAKNLSGLRIALVLAATVVCAGLVAPNVLAAKTKGKMVKRTLLVQDARVSGNGVQVSGKVISKRELCLTAGVNLFRTDAAGTILSGPIASVDTNKKGAWQIFGPTAVTSADRFVVRTKKGPKLKTKKGKWICTKATTAPFAATQGTGPNTPPGAQPPAVNHPPQFPSAMNYDVSNKYGYECGNPYLCSVRTTITVLSPASDPDGDPISYSWSVSNGSIESQNGLTVVWKRSFILGHAAAGSATITASDGKGGTATFTFYLPQTPP